MKRRVKNVPVTALVPVRRDEPFTLAERRPDLANEANAFATASLAENTHRALRFDWAVFIGWCTEQGLAPLPASPDTVAGFLVDQAKVKAVATLVRYRASITKMHRLTGLVSPFTDARVKAVLAGIRRKKGVAQHRKSALTIELASAIGGTDARAVRDRAVLLVGIATSFRGDELCSLDIEDVTWQDSGEAVVLLRKSKTDQTRVGRSVGVPRIGGTACPAGAMRALVDLMGEESGPLFRRHERDGSLGAERLGRKAVSEIVKRAVSAAGHDGKDFGSHSLRAGYVNEARRAGLDWVTIMAQTGHKKLETVQRYDRGAIDPFKASKVRDVFESAAKRRKKR